jgi:hypothetical protein
MVDVGKPWNLGRPLLVPAVGVLFGVGVAGEPLADRTITRRHQPPPR